METIFSFDTMCVIWFLVLGVLLTGYAVLDGFDLGVGILHPIVARDDIERRASMNSIGPLWDGNEVWLVTFGGAMFAMFPNAYASIFSGFYLAFMLLLFALILRAVSLEFRGKRASQAWRSFWDYAFFLGSFLATLLFGVAVGNVLRGVPLDARGNFTHGLLSQVHPYAVLVGLLAVALFALHGSLYLYLKTEGALQKRLAETMWTCFGLFLVLYLFVTMYTLAAYPYVLDNFRRYPWLWAVPVLHVLAVANIPRALYLHRAGYAFVSNCVNILALVGLLGIGIYPHMLRDPGTPEYSITIFNAASSLLTLRIGLLIAALGMPFVISYTGIIYWMFRGKVRIDHHSY